MAYEADCGSSTVLDSFEFLVLSFELPPAGDGASRRPPWSRRSPMGDLSRRSANRGAGSRKGEAGWVENSKFEIRNLRRWAAFLIPNSPRTSSSPRV